MHKFIVAQIPSSSAGKGNLALQIKAVYNIAQIQDDPLSFELAVCCEHESVNQ